jgi:hypothetical protein
LDQPSLDGGQQVFAAQQGEIATPGATTRRCAGSTGYHQPRSLSSTAFDPTPSPLPGFNPREEVFGFATANRSEGFRPPHHKVKRPDW